MYRISAHLISALSSVSIAGLLWFPQAAAGGGSVISWCGTNVFIPGDSNVVAIAAGYGHTLLLKDDRTVTATGSSGPTGYYVCYGCTSAVPVIIPAVLNNVVAVGAGDSHSLALKADGTVVAWGLNQYGQTNVPQGLRNVVAISAGANHNLALKADGTVVGWGGTGANVPSGLTNIIAVSAGRNTSLALTGEGKILGWNLGNLSGDLAIVSNIVAISAGPDCCYSPWLALQADGKFGSLNDVIALSDSRGTDHNVSLALLIDGTVAPLLGFNYCGGPPIPSGLTNVVEVAASDANDVALFGGGPPFLVNRLVSRSAVMSGQTFFRIEATGARSLSYRWQFNGADLPGETNTVLALTNLQPGQVGSYSVVVSNAFGPVTSESAQLYLFPLRINVQPQSQTNFVGGTASLRAAAQGIEPFHYQWRLDGSDLAGATNATLLLNNLRMNQAGVYSVMVTNNFGTILSSNATLTVVPILIKAQPQGQVMFIGGTASFCVTAQGAQPIYYQWQFNSTDLTGATNSTLTLVSLAKEQTGAYSVTLSNVNGAVKSINALLSVVRVAGWGDIGQAAVSPILTNAIGIASGYHHNLGLTAEGKVAAWGDNGYGQLNIPPGLTDVVAVAAGTYALQSQALKENGTIVSWGSDSYPPPWVPADLSNFVASAAGNGFNIALRADGTVLAYGGSWGLPPAGLSNVVAISAGEEHSLALKSDGTVTAWGINDYGQAIVPAGLSNVVAISAGAQHNIALRTDGTMIAWGDSFSGKTNVPVDLTNVVAIAAGENHNVVLRVDGSVAAWGSNFFGQTNQPAGLANVIAIAAADGHSLALVGEGPPVLHAVLSNPIWDNNGFRVLVPTESGRVYRLEYKKALTDTDWIGLPLVAGNGGLRTLSDPTAIGIQRFYRVRRW